MCPKSNAIKIKFLCKILVYKIESPSTPIILNIKMTTGCDLFARFPQFLFRNSKLLPCSTYLISTFSVGVELLFL